MILSCNREVHSRLERSNKPVVSHLRRKPSRLSTGIVTARLAFLRARRGADAGTVAVNSRTLDADENGVQAFSGALDKHSVFATSAQYRRPLQ